MRGYLIVLISFTLALFSCGEKVDEFSGFTKSETEFLLAGDSAKVWERVKRWEDGEEVDFSDCQQENRMIFMAGSTDASKRLLYAYNTEVCDSSGFCNDNVEYCISDTANCRQDPDFCELLSPGTLYLGTWEVMKPAIENGNTDQMLLKFWTSTRMTTITGISSLALTIEFFESDAVGIINVKEDYILIDGRSK